MQSIQLTFRLVLTIKKLNKNQREIKRSDRENNVQNIKRYNFIILFFETN